MIISKIDSVRQQKIEAHAELCRLLSTKRGCKKARIEATLRQEKANSTGVCPGCGGPLLNNPKLNGWCRTCDARLSRMMLYKSRIRLYECVGIRMTERFVEDYGAMQNIPYALHGDAAPEQVLSTANRYLEALRKEVALNENM